MGFHICVAKIASLFGPTLLVRLGKFAVSSCMVFHRVKIAPIKEQDKEEEKEEKGGTFLPKKSNASQVDISGPPTGLSWIFSSLQIYLANIFVLAAGPQKAGKWMCYKDRKNHIDRIKNVTNRNFGFMENLIKFLADLF